MGSPKCAYACQSSSVSSNGEAGKQEGGGRGRGGGRGQPRHPTSKSPGPMRYKTPPRSAAGMVPSTSALETS